MESIQNFWNKNKKLIIYILIPLIAGGIGYLLGGGNNIYDSVKRPSFAPPDFLFPIVWTILYILMGISAYIVSNSSSTYKNLGLIIYYVQLVINSLWNLFFFRLNWFLFAFIWLILLLVLVIYMVYLFSKSDKKSAWLNVPYVLWLLFAAVLNFSVFWINR